MPSALRREPCGMVQVVIRAISIISPVSTAETLEATMSPCRLKFTTQAYQPSGLTWAVAGKGPSTARLTGCPVRASIFHRLPPGMPCAVLTK